MRGATHSLISLQQLLFAGRRFLPNAYLHPFNRNSLS